MEHAGWLAAVALEGAVAAFVVDNQTRPRAGAGDFRVKGDLALLEFGVGAFEGDAHYGFHAGLAEGHQRGARLAPGQDRGLSKSTRLYSQRTGHPACLPMKQVCSCLLQIQ